MKRTLLACALLAALPASAPASGRHDWTRFGFDAARSGSSTAPAGIAASDLPRLRRRVVRVPGIVDSSPIYLHAVRVRHRRRDVFVATTNYGRTFALDARRGRRLWTYSPPGVAGLEGTPQITTGSPVADPGRRYVYAPSPDGHIRKLALKNGHEVRSRQWPAVVTRDPTHEKLGTPLNVSGRYVIETTGGYFGDVPPYQGHVALVSRRTGAVAHVFNSLCSDRLELIDPASCPSSGSAIWARAGAVVVPRDRRILVATGNAPFNGRTDWGDSVLELSSDATRLLGNWTPINQQELASSDGDLGSTAPALLPFGKRWLGLQGGKDGLLRLLDLANLNGRGRPCDCLGGELQTLPSPRGSGVLTAPAVWRHGGRTWVFVAVGGVFASDESATAAYQLSGSPPPLLHRVWITDRAGTSPVVAGGLLYVYDPGGGLVVYEPTKGRRLAVLPIGPGHWNTPVVADGRIALGEGAANDDATSGKITIWHLPGR